MEKTTVTLQDIKEAVERIRPPVIHTPLIRGEKLDQRLNCQVFLKPEMLQITGSFKPRGALNKVLSLPKESLEKGYKTLQSSIVM